MKIADRAVIILLTCCIMAVSILVPINIMVTSENFYKDSLKETGLYPEENKTSQVYYIGGDSNKCAAFTQGQFDTIIAHITAYFKDEKDSFGLVMNEVKLNGTMTNGVEVFGEKAVKHMADVKPVFAQCNVATAVSFVLIVAASVYIVIRRKETKRLLFKYSLIPPLFLIGCAALFLGYGAIVHLASNNSSFFYTLWKEMHLLFFPFSPDKIAGSSMNDALTYILSQEFFLGAVNTVLISLALMTVTPIVFFFFISKRQQKEQN